MDHHPTGWSQKARKRVVAYPLLVIWGLVAVFAAERADQPLTAWFSLAAAVLVDGVMLWRTKA